MQWVRTLRLFRIMHVEGRFLTAFSTFKEIFAEKGRVLLTTGFLGISVWLVVSALYYLAEKDNEEMILRCGTYSINRFGDIPSVSEIKEPPFPS